QIGLLGFKGTCTPAAVTNSTPGLCEVRLSQSSSTERIKGFPHLPQFTRSKSSPTSVVMLQRGRKKSSAEDGADSSLRVFRPTARVRLHSGFVFNSASCSLLNALTSSACALAASS